MRTKEFEFFPLTSNIVLEIVHTRDIAYSVHTTNFCLTYQDTICHSFDTRYMEYANVRAMCYARYLGLGMRYEAGIYTIVISMKGAFK